jgi:hypothetical protein
VRGLVEPSLPQILEFCSEDPVERVFLEDVARRGLGRFVGLGRRGQLQALCHVGANVVPAGSGCGAFGRRAARGGARMLIGEEGAVGELWQDAQRRMPVPREDRPGQPVYVLEEPPEPGGTGLRPATEDDFDLLLPACASAHLEELGVDPLERDRPPSAGGRASRSRRAARGSGARATRSSSRPRPPRGRRRRCSSSRCGSIAGRRNRGYAQRRDARPLPPAARSRARRLPVRAPENMPAIRVYEGSACAGRSATGA